MRFALRLHSVSKSPEFSNILEHFDTLIMDGADDTLATVERKHIQAVLQRTKGRISGPNDAAGILGLHPNTLRSHMQKLDLR